MLVVSCLYLVWVVKEKHSRGDTYPPFYCEGYDKSVDKKEEGFFELKNTVCVVVVSLIK